MVTEPERRDCAWCDEKKAWPDACGLYRGDEACRQITLEKCEEGDHRRCFGEDCDVAADWHLDVRRAGVLAAQAAGTTWAVVSIADDAVHVVGTNDHLGRAKSLQRTPAAKRGGFTGPAAKGAVYIVRVTDGEFF